MQTFWNTIALYNFSTWIYQILIILTGIFITYALIRKPTPVTKLLMKCYLVFIYLWISVVYYAVYCEQRNYHNIMSIFWAIMGAIWIWEIFSGYTKFERTYKYDKLAYLLMFMPFVYPVFSLARGLGFPMMTSPLMPCSVVTFTIGLLLLFSRNINIFIVLPLCHWSLIGLSKTYFFGIPEDFLLASASVPALYLFFREYFMQDLHKSTKPRANIVNTLLIGICIGIGILLTTAMFKELM